MKNLHCLLHLHTKNPVMYLMLIIHPSENLEAENVSCSSRYSRLYVEYIDIVKTEVNILQRHMIIFFKP